MSKYIDHIKNDNQSLCDGDIMDLNLKLMQKLSQKAADAIFSIFFFDDTNIMMMVINF